MTPGEKRDYNQIKESVEKLTGERGNNPAIRRSDLLPIASITLKSASAPGDVNALQADVKALHDALVRISNLFGTAGR